MYTAINEKGNSINPLHLNLLGLCAYIRGGVSPNKKFPSPSWFTASRMGAIHRKIACARIRFHSDIGPVSTDTMMEVERYYLSFLAVYQHQFDTKKVLSIKDWHSMLVFLADRTFYWSMQHRINVAQVESMLRTWMLIRFHYKNRSLCHASNLCPTRTNIGRCQPSAGSRERRAIKSQGRGGAVRKSHRAAAK